MLDNGIVNVLLNARQRTKGGFFVWTLWRPAWLERRDIHLLDNETIGDSGELVYLCFVGTDIVDEMPRCNEGEMESSKWKIHSEALLTSTVVLVLTHRAASKTMSHRPLYTLVASRYPGNDGETLHHDYSCTVRQRGQAEALLCGRFKKCNR